MIQSVYLTMAGGFSHEEAFAVCADRDLSVLRCVLRGYQYQPGDTVLLRATKPDGTVCYLSGTPEGENTVCFTLSEQMTARHGDVQCDVSVQRGMGSISSDAFLIKVRPPSATGEDLKSENEYTGLMDLLLNAMGAREITEEDIDAMWEEEKR